MGSGLCAVLEAALGSDYPWAASLASLGRVQDLGSAPGQAAVQIWRTTDPNAQAAIYSISSRRWRQIL